MFQFLRFLMDIFRSYSLIQKHSSSSSLLNRATTLPLWYTTTQNYGC